MSADMDKWERDQQRKHTEAKRVRRTFRRLGRELTQSSQNSGDERRSPERLPAPSVPHTTENPQR